MKRILTIFLAVLLLTGCGAQQAQPTETEATTVPTTVPETTETVPETTEPEPQPVYANQIANGTYEITADSNASMFRIVKCVLSVEDDSMRATITLGGLGYGYVYMGTGEEALADSEESYIPFVLNEDGAKDFTVPVEALNVELDCASWSIRKEKWYDRVLVFESEALPPEAYLVE